MDTVIYEIPVNGKTYQGKARLEFTGKVTLSHPDIPVPEAVIAMLKLIEKQKKEIERLKNKLARMQ